MIKYKRESLLESKVDGLHLYFKTPEEIAFYARVKDQEIIGWRVSDKRGNILRAIQKKNNEKKYMCIEEGRSSICVEIP